MKLTRDVQLYRKMRGLREIGFGICEREGERSYKMLSGLEWRLDMGERRPGGWSGDPVRCRAARGTGGGGHDVGSIGSMDRFFFFFSLFSLSCTLENDSLRRLPNGNLGALWLYTLLTLFGHGTTTS